jgi:hypothetical protein
MSAASNPLLERKELLVKIDDTGRKRNRVAQIFKNAIGTQQGAITLIFEKLFFLECSVCLLSDCCLLLPAW